MLFDFVKRIFRLKQKTPEEYVTIIFPQKDWVAAKEFYKKYMTSGTYLEIDCRANRIINFDFVSPTDPTITQDTFFDSAYFALEFPPDTITPSNLSCSEWLVIGYGLGDEDAGGMDESIVVNKMTGEMGYCDLYLWDLMYNAKSDFNEDVTIISSNIGEFIERIESSHASIKGV